VNEQVIRMAKKSRTSILKRQRELRKAEKAAMKREKRDQRPEDEEEEAEAGGQVATRDDLAGYGFPVDEEAEEEKQG
jgi:hypothetical protein